MAKTIYMTKDLKGIKVTGEVKDLVNRINHDDGQSLNEYTIILASGSEREAYQAVAYYALKNGMFERNKYYDGNPYDLKRISWFISDLFNCTVGTATRFLRELAHYSPYSKKVSFYDRFGLNTFSVE